MPNPPIAYAPTLQEQWQMRKQQQQQQQQPQSVIRSVPFSGGGNVSSQFTQPQFYPIQVQQQQQQQGVNSNSKRGNEIIIPVQIERSDESNRNRLNDQPPSPRYTGASFPSRSFQALRMMTGEDPFTTFPSSSNFFTPMESPFNTGFVGGASGNY